MKKFNAAGVLVAAGAAVALVGLGTPAFASTSTVVRHLHPAIASHPLSAAANTCDGDHDSDDVNCGTSANKCDGDNDSDDVGCTTGSTSANKCDGDHDSDDVNCGTSANKCDGDNDSDDVGCTTGSTSANKCDGDHDSDDWNCGTSANKCDGDNDSDDVGCTTGSTSANKCDGDHDSDDWNCTGPSGHPMIPVWGHHHMFWHMHASSSHSWAMAEHHSSVASWLDRVKDSVLRLI